MPKNLSGGEVNYDRAFRIRAASLRVTCPVRAVNFLRDERSPVGGWIGSWRRGEGEVEVHGRRRITEGDRLASGVMFENEYSDVIHWQRLARECRKLVRAALAPRDQVWQRPKTSLAAAKKLADLKV